MDLFVGRAFFEINEDDIVSYLRSRGASSTLIANLNQADEIKSFDLLNAPHLAEHVFKLDGYSDMQQGYADLADGRFRLKHFPAWEESNWMPFEFDQPGLTHEGSITWVGSCHGLLRDLADIAARSPLPLSEPPPHYRSMLEGLPDFWRTAWDTSPLSPDELIRWEWCALRDGAELAIRENSVLSATPE